MTVLKYPDGLQPNLLAGGWTLFAYLTGLWLCLRPALPANAVGVALLGHSMVVAAYLVHECAHNTIFARPAWNARLGALLNWVTGALYSPFEQLRHKHMRHHVDRADVVAFDYRRSLRAAPPGRLRIIRILESVGVPAVEFGLRGLAIAVPFRGGRHAHLRRRVLWIGLARLAFFCALAAISLRILLLYPLAYLASLQVLRYMDAHQHTFDLRADLGDPAAVPGPAAGLDRDFEERNTFSNPLSERWPALNLLVLNFGYHNAHHLRPAQPWYRLPALHRERYGSAHQQTLPSADVRYAFLRFRVQRTVNEDPPDSGVHRDTAADFVGVDGVSFLVPY